MIAYVIGVFVIFLCFWDAWRSPQLAASFRRSKARQREPEHSSWNGYGCQEFAAPCHTHCLHAPMMWSNSAGEFPPLGHLSDTAIPQKGEPEDRLCRSAERWARPKQRSMPRPINAWGI